jgi:hypothetical protein
MCVIQYPLMDLIIISGLIFHNWIIFQLKNNSRFLYKIVTSSKLANLRTKPYWHINSNI